MRNAFGLRFVYLFFNMPFLCLQRETLRRQLETNTEEMRCSDIELDCYHETLDANYDAFMNAITQRRRHAAEAAGASALASSPGSIVRQPMGGGLPIPGQFLPVKPNVPSFDEQASLCSLSSSSRLEHHLSNSEQSAVHSVKRSNITERGPPITVSTGPTYSCSDDECANGMVRTLEDDFEADDELKEKMSRLATELNTRDSPYFSTFSANNLPLKMEIDDRNLNSTDDQCGSPEREKSDGSIIFNSKLEVFQQPLDSDVTTAIPTSAPTSDFDAWLGDDGSLSLTEQKKYESPLGESSEEETGMDPLPSRSSYSTDVINSALRASEIIPPFINDVKKKKKKRTSCEKSAGRNKTNNVTDPVNGRPRNKERSSKNLNVLEEFLEGIELGDYDPL